MASDIPTKCPLCSTSAPSAFERTHNESGILYTLYECDSCRVQFWWPLKNPGAAWYSRDTRYADRNADPIWEANENHTKTFSFLAPYIGTVLDIGCGIGNFLALAKEKGWKGTGIDFDPNAIESARNKIGIDDLEVTDVVTYVASHPEKKFDLITFFDVLEHVDNHNEFIDSIRSLLAPKGYIAMSMPYRKHAEWLMPLDVPPRHLTRWDRTSLKRFLEARGFNVVYMTRRAVSIREIILKLRFKYGKKLSFGAVRAVRSNLNDSGTTKGNRPLLVRVVHLLAKMKDGILFGIPAIIIWLVMLPSSRRYATLYAIARKTA